MFKHGHRLFAAMAGNSNDKNKHLLGLFLVNVNYHMKKDWFLMESHKFWGDITLILKIPSGVANLNIDWLFLFNVSQKFEKASLNIF